MVKKTETEEAVDPLLRDYIREMREIRDKLDDQKATTKKYNERKEQLTGLIVAKLREEGLTKVSTPEATASVSSDRYPVIKNWDTALPFIVEHHSELLSKKVSAPGWRDLLDEGQTIPGVEAFEKDSLNFRRNKGNN